MGLGEEGGLLTEGVPMPKSIVMLQFLCIFMGIGNLVLVGLLFARRRKAAQTVLIAIFAVRERCTPVRLPCCTALSRTTTTDGALSIPPVSSHPPTPLRCPAGFLS